MKENELKKFPQMVQEIFQEPDLIRSLLSIRWDGDSVLFPESKLIHDELLRINRIVITGAGTSHHAALLGKLYIEKVARIPVEVSVASEFFHTPGDKRTLVLALSMGGESPETVGAARTACKNHSQVIALTNRKNSALAGIANHTILLHAGEEIGVGSTKGFMSQIFHLYLFSLHLAKIKWLISSDDMEDAVSELRALPNKMEMTLNYFDNIQKQADSLLDVHDFILLGRSYNHPSAMEGALKLKENSGVHATGYPGGEFKHGPIALISNDMPVICITPKTEIHEKMISNIEEVKARRAKLIVIHTEGDPEAERLSDVSWTIPECVDYLTPFLTLIPLQLFACAIGIKKDIVLDRISTPHSASAT